MPRSSARPTTERTPPVELAAQRGYAPLPGKTLWTLTVGRGQWPRFLAERQPQSSIFCLILDAYLAEAAEAHGPSPANLTWGCQADWPEGPCDGAILLFDTTGSQELARDLIQAAYARLSPGHPLVLVVPADAEAWAREQLKVYNHKIRVTSVASGLWCEITKTTEPWRQRDFAFAGQFRDGANLIHFATRPGVFAHRKLDLGARQLLKQVALVPGQQRLLEIGCGSGAVSAALAVRHPGLEIRGMDSNPRAVEAYLTTAQLNGIAGAQAFLGHDTRWRLETPADVVLANPPYFSQYRISELFCQMAAQNLAINRPAYFVTKNIEWYHKNFGRWFTQIRAYSRSGYHIIVGNRAAEIELAERVDVDSEF